VTAFRLDWSARAAVRALAIHSNHMEEGGLGFRV